MIDGFGRTIDYVRISVTDRCDLRCVYCMPETGMAWLPHAKILRYEDILRLAGVFVSLGIVNFKITGGEPLVRTGVETLISGIRAMDGVRSVTLTTNGVRLAEKLPALLDAGIDGINLSLDTLDPARYAALTRRGALPEALRGLEAALAVPGLNLKLNCVAMAGGEGDWAALAALAKERAVAVRFIEPMPIGPGQRLAPCGEDAVRAVLEAEYGPMTPCGGPAGNGPCRYFSLPGFAGKIGFISAVSHKFCAGCNRVRLTSTGFLKTCLQYDVGADLAPLLSGTDDARRAAIETAILHKPEAHQFPAGDVQNRERRTMSQIGG